MHWIFEKLIQKGTMYWKQVENKQEMEHTQGS
jgi:hypothetical protein